MHKIRFEIILQRSNAIDKKRIFNLLHEINSIFSSPLFTDYFFAAHNENTFDNTKSSKSLKRGWKCASGGNFINNSQQHNCFAFCGTKTNKKAHSTDLFHTLRHWKTMLNTHSYRTVIVKCSQLLVSCLSLCV